MQLLYPSFLWALLLLAVPIIIHLFRFRRYKTVFFSNVRFLKSVQQESTSRNRLKHLLVLACRLLALAALIFAFTQPFIAGKKTPSATGKNYVSIFIDNSFSMNRLSNNFNLLDRAKQMAVEIVKSFEEQDRFHLLSNNFSGNENRLLSRDEMLAAIEELTFSSASKSIDAVAKRQNEVLSMEGGTVKTAFVISDFQESTTQNTIWSDSTFMLNLVPLESADVENIAIDTCYFTEPFQISGKQATLLVKIKNYGADDAPNISRTFLLNGQAKSNVELSIAAGSFVIDTISFNPEKTGWNEVEISIDDAPITYDNTYYLAFDAVAKLNVLNISEGSGNKFVRAVFGKNEQFNLEEISANAFNIATDNFSLVILSNLKNISADLSAALSSYIANGGSVLLFPAFDSDKESYNKFLLSNGALQIDEFSETPTQAANINLQQNIFKDVFEKAPENMRFPTVKKHALFSKAISVNREDILKTKEDNLLIARFSSGIGNLYVSAVSVDEQNSELPVSAVFAPMLFKMAVLNGVTAAHPVVIGNKSTFNLSAVAGKENVFRLKSDKTEFIPQQFSSNNSTVISPGEALKTSGFYKVLQPGSDSAIAVIAANYNRAESNMKFLNSTVLKKIFENNPNVNVLSGSFLASGKKITEAVHSKPLWKYFLSAALLFLLAEILLLRFWKTEQFAKAV